MNTNLNYSGISLNRSNPWEGLFSGLQGFTEGISNVGKSIEDMGEAQKNRTKRNQLDTLRTRYEQMRNARNDLKNLDEDKRRWEEEEAANEARFNAEQDAEEAKWNQTHQYKSSGKLSNEGLDKKGIKELQAKLGVTADGIWGPKSQKALDEYNAKAKPEIKKTVLGYLDGDFQRKAYQPNTWEQQELYDELKRVAGDDEAEMDYALQMKALGDSTLYDELVRQQNLQLQRDQLEDVKNKEAKSEAKKKSEEEADKKRQGELQKMKYYLTEDLDEIAGLTVDPKTGLVKSQNKAINGKTPNELREAIFQKYLDQGFTEEEVMSIVNSNNELRQMFGAIAKKSNAPKNTPKKGL